MKNFWRAIQVTFQYKWNIIGAIVCALCLALCWGGNIATVYPLVQVSFQGDTISIWVEKEIADHQEKIRQQEEERDRLIQESKEKNTWAIQNLEEKIVRDKRELRHFQQAKPYVDRYTPDDPFLTVVWLMLFVLIGTVVKSVFTFWHGILSTRLGQLGSYDIRETFFKKLLDYEVNYFSQQGIADSMSRFTGDMGTLSNGLSLVYGKTVREPLKMIVCVVGAAIVNWRLLLFICLFLPLAGLMISWLAKSLKRVVRRALVQMALLYGRIEETFRSVRVVKAFNREDYELAKFRETNQACFKRAMKTAKYDSMTSPITECLGISMMIVAILVSAYLAIRQQTTLFGIPMASRPMTLGSLLLFYGFLIGASDPARRLSDIFSNIQGAVAAADRVYEMIDRVVPVAEVENPKPFPRFQNNLTFENVCFEYIPVTMPQSEPRSGKFRFFKRKKSGLPAMTQAGGSGETNATADKSVSGKPAVDRAANHPVLHNISLEIKFGETVAIVGPSGCGKSTLLNLIPRFADPSSGQIFIDSLPLKELRLHDLRNQIGLVNQESVLFNDTVFENIRYSVPDATREQVIDAAKQAYAHQFIVEELANGYETVVGPGGGQLSGGQRQRIALARAILKDPGIFLLDEATSQIDVRSEQFIHQALAQYIGNRTTIIVTHRLSAIRLADQIVVMQDGVIEQVGTHQELLQKSPFYANLWQTEGGGPESVRVNTPSNS